MIAFAVLNFILNLIWFCVIGSVATLIILAASAFIRGEFKK